MKKNMMICFALAVMITGCKKVDVDFNFSPAEPRAGETVKFTNTSSAGENWNWDFGDNTSSILKNPYHTFTKPGTYLVTLMVDSAKYNTISHTVTVYDTIPTFTTTPDSICHYADITLTANVYNPYAYPLTYQWSLPEECILVSGELIGRAIIVYFTQYNQDAVIGLSITQNGKKYDIERTLHVHESKAPAIVMQLTDKTIMRQRIINDRIETAEKNIISDNVAILNTTTDTVVTFNGTTFYASQMNDIFPDKQVSRMQLDAMAQKWYITTPQGLFVTNFDGQNIVLIDEDATRAVHVDPLRNLLLWATNDGLKAMPLVKSKNNQFATTPTLYNTIGNIDRIVVNNTLQ